MIPGKILFTQGVGSPNPSRKIQTNASASGRCTNRAVACVPATTLIMFDYIFNMISWLPPTRLDTQSYCSGDKIYA